MKTSKLVSVKYIIEKVMRDTKLDDEIEFDDMLEWIWEGLSEINTPMLYRTRITDGVDNNIVVITDSKGILPNDLISIIGVRDYYSKQPLIEKEDSFTLSQSSIASLTSTSGIPLVATTTSFDTDDNIVKRESELYYEYISSTIGTYFGTYWIEENYIHTSFESGNLEILYRSFPIDSDGFPMIPDKIYIIKAISAKLVERLLYRMYLTDRIAREKYDRAEQDYCFQKSKAITTSGMPSEEEMEALKNTFVRLRTDPYMHRSSFSYSHEQEQLLLHR